MSEDKWSVLSVLSSGRVESVVRKSLTTAGVMCVYYYLTKVPFHGLAPCIEPPTAGGRRSVPRDNKGFTSHRRR